uniref:VirD4-like conjugal transfer protein, CD1115 family n=1 Tax=[Lactobacillus] rogosae TaxID=706562 RepID=UPI00402A9A97
MLKNRKVSYKVYLMLLAVVMLFSLFFAGIFSYEDTNIFNIPDKLTELAGHFWQFNRYFNAYTIQCLGWGFLVWIFLCYVIMDKMRNWQSHIAYGSEDWGNAEDVTKRRANKDESCNRIISKNLRIDTQGADKASNNNMVVVASSGKFKTTSVVVPNLLAGGANKIVLDVKGELMRNYGLYLKEKGYTIRCLDLKYPEQSDRYNPFAYIQTEEDIIKLIANIQKSLTPPDAMKGEPFWDEGVALYLQAVFYYEWWYAKKEGRTGTFNNVLKLVNDEAKKDTSRPVEKGKQPPTLLQIKMDKLADEDSPDNPAVRDYRKLKDGAAETVRSIIIITNAKLKLCETKALKRIFEDDDMHLTEYATGVGGTLDKPNKNKLITFLCVDDSDQSYNFVCSMLYSQALTILMRMADNNLGGSLPIPLELWLDEFYAGARPADCAQLMGVIRSRNISMIPILQSVSQLKDLYQGEKAEIIHDNCPIFWFGGCGQGAIETQKAISELLGKATVDIASDGSNGNNKSTNYQKTGRELMTPAEIKNMDKHYCIIFLEDERPIYDRKSLPWEDNPLYKQAMQLNEESGVGGYIVEPKSMVDPHTGEYVTIQNSINIEETDELPEGVKPIDVFSDEFLHMNFASKEPADDEVNEELKRLYALKKSFTQKENKRKATEKSRKAVSSDVTESVTDDSRNIRTDKMDSSISDNVPASIEDGIMQYFRSMDSGQRKLIQMAIENNMPELLIRKMFVMQYDTMKQFYDSYFN